MNTVTERIKTQCHRVPTFMMLAFRGIPGLLSDALSTPADPAGSGASPQSPFHTDTEPVGSRCVSASSSPPLPPPGFSVNSAMSEGLLTLTRLCGMSLEVRAGWLQALALTHTGDNGSNLWRVRPHLDSMHTTCLVRRCSPGCCCCWRWWRRCCESYCFSITSRMKTAPPCYCHLLN